jgi:hypothetical protein
MKYVFIVGGICQFAVAGMITFSGYEAGIVSQVFAYISSGIWLITASESAYHD